MSKKIEKYTWEDLRKHKGMGKSLFADWLDIEKSNYSRKESYERKMNARELRELVNRFEWLNVNNIITCQEELDEYLED